MTSLIDRKAGFIALATAGALWGTPFVFAKWVQNDISVGHLVLLRFVFASLALAPVLWREHRKQPIHIARRDMNLFFWAALLGVPRTTVSHASLMVGLLPAILAGGAAIFANERMDQTRWIAVGLSTCGAALVAFGGVHLAGKSASFIGDLMVALSLFGGAAWVLLSQRIMQRNYSSVVTSAIVVMIGTVLLAVWVLATEGAPDVQHLSWHAWIAVIAMGVLATATTTLLWNWGLSRVEASQAGVFVNLEPVVGTLLGITLFHEQVGALGLAGGTLIVGAAIVVARS
jgi:drug/metabolite transporter (DMT)-like permease